MGAFQNVLMWPTVHGQWQDLVYTSTALMAHYRGCLDLEWAPPIASTVCMFKTDARGEVCRKHHCQGHGFTGLSLKKADIGCPSAILPEAETWHGDQFRGGTGVEGWLCSVRLGLCSSSYIQHYHQLSLYSCPTLIVIIIIIITVAVLHIDDIHWASWSMAGSSSKTLGVKKFVNRTHEVNRCFFCSCSLWLIALIWVSSPFLPCRIRLATL